MKKKSTRKPPRSASKPRPRPRTPRVFISYTHENDDHKRWVREISSDLIHNGIDVVLDQWDLLSGADIAKFMEEGIAEADRVLMVFTPEYKRKAEDRQGGVGYENLVITGELVRDLDTTKFIGILATGTSADAVPSFFATRKYLDFRVAESYRDTIEELVRELHGVPRNPKPELEPSPFGAGGRGKVRTATRRRSASRPARPSPATAEPHEQSVSTGGQARRTDQRPAHVAISYQPISTSQELHRYALIGRLTLNIPPTQAEWLLKILWPADVRCTKKNGFEASNERVLNNVRYEELVLHGTKKVWPGETVDIIGPDALAEIEYEVDDQIWHLLQRQTRQLAYTLYLEDHRPVEGTVSFAQLNRF